MHLSLAILIQAIYLLPYVFGRAVTPRYHVNKRESMFTQALNTKFTRSSSTIAPKVMIVSLFGPEEAAWPSHVDIYSHNITVPGLSPLFPQVHCTSEGDICQFTTGEGVINSASSTSALIYSSFFDFSQTYFLIAGVAGINPGCATLGSVALAKYVVQTDLQYLIDPRDLNKTYNTHSGFIPLGTKDPEDYPVFLYGTEVFELNEALLDRAFNAMQRANLTTSQQAQQYSAKYAHSAAKGLPTVFKGDIATTDVYFNGQSISDAFSWFVNKLTNGTGTYCSSGQEDNGILEAMLRGAVANRIDFNRIVAARVGINFDQPPPGESSPEALFYDNSGGPAISFPNIYIAGIEFVNDVINNWTSVYKEGITATNYVGDILGTLKGPYQPDIGSSFSTQG